MKSLFSKLNFILIVFVLIGIFFSSARTIIHINSSVENHQHNNFFNKYIKWKETYEKNRGDILGNDVCEKIEGRQIHRHHLRWVFEKARLIIFDQFEHNNSGKKLSYIYSMMLVLLIGLSFFFSILTINRNIYDYVNKNKLNFTFLFLIFFFIISFYSFRDNQETRFSFFELFFLSAALYFAHIKKKLLFLITVVLATLNRESGILISAIWFLMNGFSIINKKIIFEKNNLIFGIFVGIFCIVALVAFNYQIFSCGFKIELFFFEAIEPEVQSSLLRNLNIIFYNIFIVIFLLYFFWIDFHKQFKLLLLIIFYCLVFLIFSRFDNNILRIILAPLFVLYCNEYLIKQKIK